MRGQGLSLLSFLFISKRTKKEKGITAPNPNGYKELKRRTIEMMKIIKGKFDTAKVFTEYIDDVTIKQINI